MKQVWEADLAEAVAVLARLDVSRVVADARAAAAGWKPVEPFSSFFLPLPLIAQDVPSLAGAWGVEGGEMDAVLQMVAAGLGVAVVPGMVVRRLGAELMKRSLEDLKAEVERRAR